MPKLLMVSTVASTLKAFLLPHVKMLQSKGWIADGAANGISANRECLETFNSVHEMPWTRKPLSAANRIAAKRIVSLVTEGGYDVVHVHTPVASAVTRWALRKIARERKIKIIYTAHGFHFYKGGPLLNWLVYYPIEKFLSRYTDVLVTINKEDYAIAKNKMHAKRTEYIPGVGIDIEKIESVSIDRNKKRAELGLPEDALVLLSVGELSKRKNHEVVIKALAEPQLKGNEKIRCLIAGQGALKDCLAGLAAKSGLSERVQLLGFRTDVTELCKAADIFVFPSLQEGLPVALMEAMACGLPVACSKIRGNTDLVEEGANGFMFPPKDVAAARDAITKMLSNPPFAKECGERNKEIARGFSLEKSLKAMARIYEELHAQPERRKERAGEQLRSVSL